jgi:hypothetical protein
MQRGVGGAHGIDVAVVGEIFNVLEFEYGCVLDAATLHARQI